MAVKDPATTTLGMGGNTFTQAQATQIFDTLWANNRITMFAVPGDSGSWLVKDDGTVVGILNRAGWEERDPRDLNILGHNWGSFDKFAWAYSINSAVTYANNLLAADSTLGFSIEVCVESSRPKPPASASNAAMADCTSGTVTGTTCSWPYACKPNPTANVSPACINQDPAATAAPAPSASGSP